MISAYPLLLFIIDSISYLFISISAFYRYYRLRYKPDLYMGLGFIFIYNSSIFRFLSSLTESEGLATFYFQTLNGFFIMPAIFLWFVGFTLYYKGDFDFKVVMVGYITGLLGGAFVFSDQVYVTYDSVTQNWNGVYPPTFFILIVPLILFAFIRIIQPMIRRYRYTNERGDQNTLLGMTFGVVLVLIWGLTALITEIDFIRLFRPIFLSLGWLTWYLSSQRNPFFLSVSDVQPSRIMVTNNQGHLFFSYLFNDEETEQKSELLAPLVQAINNMAREVLKSDTGVKSYDVGDNKVVSVSIGNYYYHLISRGIDDAIVSLFNYFAQNTINTVKKAGMTDYIDLTQEVKDYFNKLVIIKPKESRVGDLDIAATPG